MSKEISDEEFDELQRLRSGQALNDVTQAKLRLRADHPHLPVTLIDAFQGSAEDVATFGQKLLEQFPIPQPSQPAPAPAPQTPPQAVGPATPAPAAPPAAPAPAPAEPNAVAQLLSQVQSVQAHQPVPMPGPDAQLPAAGALEARRQELLVKIRQGRASQAEALELSQMGFTRAWNEHSRKLATSPAG